MRKIKIVIAAFVATITISVWVAVAGVPGAIWGKQPTYTATTDLKWYKSPLPFGIRVSPIYGDITKKEHITYIRFPAGTKVPMHVHSTDYVGVVINGNMRHPVKGKSKTDVFLPPGSHWSIPANVKHVTECLPGTECIALMYQKRKFDYSLVNKRSNK